MTIPSDVDLHVTRFWQKTPSLASGLRHPAYDFVANLRWEGLRIEQLD
jgi:hypothetical protein